MHTIMRSLSVGLNTYFRKFSTFFKPNIVDKQNKKSKFFFVKELSDQQKVDCLSREHLNCA